MNLNVQENVTSALIGGGVFLLLAIVSKGSLGGGDVKLIAALGLWLGVEKLIFMANFYTNFGEVIPEHIADSRNAGNDKIINRK